MKAELPQPNSDAIHEHSVGRIWNFSLDLEPNTAGRIYSNQTEEEACINAFKQNLPIFVELCWQAVIFPVLISLEERFEQENKQIGTLTWGWVEARGQLKSVGVLPWVLQEPGTSCFLFPSKWLQRTEMLSLETTFQVPVSINKMSTSEGACTCFSLRYFLAVSALASKWFLYHEGWISVALTEVWGQTSVSCSRASSSVHSFWLEIALPAAAGFLTNLRGWSHRISMCYFVMLVHWGHLPHFPSAGDHNELF